MAATVNEAAEFASIALEPARPRNPFRVEAEETFLKDLPALLGTWDDYFVAYYGKSRLGISYSYDKLRRRFAQPPFGRRTLWELLFGSKTQRHDIDDLSIFYVSPIWLETDFETTSEIDVETDDPAVS